MRSVIYRREIIMVVVGMALTAAAQTDSFPQYARWFILPEPHLRTESTEPPVSRPDPQDEQIVNLSSSPTKMRLADMRI